MWKKYRAHSCLTRIKITLPSHSVVCECFCDCKPQPKNPVPCWEIHYSFLRTLQCTTNHSLSEPRCLVAHQISKCQEVTQKVVCFSVCMQASPFSCNCFLSGTFIAFYKNWFLSAFLILQAQKQALLLWPASSKHLLSQVCANFILSTTMVRLHPFFHGLLSNLFSTSSSAAKWIQSLFSIATTEWVPPPFYLRLSSTPEVSPLFFLPFFPTLPLSGIILCRLGQFPLSFLSHLQRTWVKLVSFPQTSPQHTYCPANILSLANYASFHPGPEERAAVLACWAACTFTRSHPEKWHLYLKAASQPEFTHLVWHIAAINTPKTRNPRGTSAPLKN